MEIKDIKSVELDRSVPFKHVIRLKDATGHSLEVIPVNEADGYAQFTVVYKAWVNHKDFHPKEER